MAVTSLSDKTKLSEFIKQISLDYPVVKFIKADHSRWDPDQSIIFYDPKATHAVWSVLHELGHMRAGHQSYKTDVELMTMELEAWEQAKQLARKYSMALAEDHIEDCMDSYRDWLHKRSTCPHCQQTGMQHKDRQYHCPNCLAKWKVSDSRFHRPYRKKENTLPKK